MERLKSNDFVNLDNIHTRALESLEKDMIDITEFEKLYGKENIQRDQDKVKKYKKIFEENNSPKEKEAKMFATIFEAIINEHAELSDWLGPNASTISTSEYDDFINGVDTIVEFNQEEQAPSHLGLAIDVTYKSSLLEKFERIKSNIDAEKLATIKYFKSSNMDFVGKLSKIPRVIISASPETIKGLIELWDTNKKKELSKHSIQFQILDEILIQMEAYEKYAEKIGNSELANKFKMVGKIISEIYNQKTKTIIDTGERDDAFENVVNHVDNLFDQ